MPSVPPNGGAVGSLETTVTAMDELNDHPRPQLLVGVR
jgi:hypothetical protein